MLRSLDLWERGRRVIPLGVNTGSKAPGHWMPGVAPIYLERGRGSHVWDVDGNEWVDFPMGLGPILLGHADERVDEAVRRQLERGVLFTLSNPLEVEVAERIVALVPGVDAVRFVKSGSEAVSAAVRVARALTGREAVLVAGYHGWHDWYIGVTELRGGVPEATGSLVSGFPFNDLDALEQALQARSGRVAAVVLEPCASEAPAPGYLEGVVDACRRHGAVSVFDEMITGFRLAPGGAREHYGVEPDISCYGKAIANGLPLAAVGGHAEAMRAFERVFVSGTYPGEALSLAAAAAVLDAIANGTVLATIRATGERLLAGLRDAVARHGVGDEVGVGSEPQRPVVATRGDRALLLRTWLIQSFAEAGVLFNGNMFVCEKHSTQDIDRALAAFDGALAAIAADADLEGMLRGPLVEPLRFKPAP
jgi:glutamate-1-semialdehyde aminotransferase